MTNSFIDGVKAGVPVALSFISSFVAVGVFLHDSGLHMIEATAMTAGVFAGPAQYGVAQALQSAQGLASLIIMVGVINIRFFVMSTALVETFRPVKLWKVLLGIPMLTTSTFAVSQSAFAKSEDTTASAHQHFYFFLGVGAISYLAAIAATFAGSALVNTMFHFPKALLTMILPTFFAAQMGTQWKETSRILSFSGGLLLVPLLRPYTGDHAILCAAICVGIIHFQINRRALCRRKLGV